MQWRRVIATYRAKVVRSDLVNGLVCLFCWIPAMICGTTFLRQQVQVRVPSRKCSKNCAQDHTSLLQSCTSDTVRKGSKEDVSVLRPTMHIIIKFEDHFVYSLCDPGKKHHYFLRTGGDCSALMAERGCTQFGLSDVFLARDFPSTV